MWEVSLDVPRRGFCVTQGTPKYWSRETDSGRKLHCAFCATCGTRLWHEEPESALISIKGGSLNEPLDVSQAIYVWVSRKLPGIVIPKDAPQFQQED